MAFGKALELAAIQPKGPRLNAVRTVAPHRDSVPREKGTPWSNDKTKFFRFLKAVSR